MRGTIEAIIPAGKETVFMRLSWKMGRVAGIDLYLHATFLLVFLFVQNVRRRGDRGGPADLLGVWLRAAA